MAKSKQVKKKAAGRKQERVRKAAPASKAIAGKRTAAKKGAPAKKPAAGKATPARKVAAKKTTPARKTLNARKAPARKAASARKPARAKAAPPARKPAPGKGTPLAARRAGPRKHATARQLSKARLPHIDDKTLGQIIAKLEEMREESQGIVSQQVQTDMLPREESSDVGDDLDQASTERDREFNLIMHQRHLRRLQQIQDAFERIADGSYGLCEGTDEPINPKRLLIMPLARYSLEYQEQQEKTLGRAVDTETGYLEGEESIAAEE